MSIDNVPETEVTENETGEFEEMVSDLNWYEYDAYEEEAFEIRSFQDESVDEPVKAKLSNPITDNPALKASFQVLQQEKI